MEKNRLKTHAFVFARGGSKGLPGKNIKPLNGKPLLQYSIEIAKKIQEIDDVFVSTDCDLIADVALNSGAKVIKRPQELATDKCPEWLAWRHAIDHVSKNFGIFERFVSLPATSPLRNEIDVSSALDKLQSKAADICIAITPASRSPYFNMVKILPDGSAQLVIKPESVLSCRQDVPEIFDITTVIYATTPSYVREHSSVFSGKVVATVVPKIRAVDIDDIYDFMFAEVLLQSENYNVER